LELLIPSPRESFELKQKFDRKKGVKK
jgi:hypothetical protein